MNHSLLSLLLHAGQNFLVGSEMSSMQLLCINSDYILCSVMTDYHLCCIEGDGQFPQVSWARQQGLHFWSIPDCSWTLQNCSYTAGQTFLFAGTVTWLEWI